MKISRLRRTLAVFLSALMLMMCMPFTAYAEDTVSVNDIINGNVTKLNVDDTINCTSSIFMYNGSFYNFVYIFFVNFGETGTAEDDWLDNTPSIRFSTTTDQFTVENSYDYYGTGHTADEYWTVKEITTSGSSSIVVLAVSDRDAGSSTGDTVISEITAITTDPDITAAKLTVGDTLPSFSPSSYTYADGSETWFSDTCWYTGENGPETYFSGTTVADGTNYYYVIGIHAPTDMTFDLDSLVLPTGWTLDVDSSAESEIYVYYNVPVEAASSTEYTITFKYQDDATADTTATTTDGKLTSLPAPTRDGYTFAGWALSDGTKVTTDTEFAAATTIYAQWGFSINENNFPDATFRQYVIDNCSGGDDILTESEIAAVTKISVPKKNISDLKGIEYFTALTSLTCNGNQLSVLDVSNNKALEELYCSSNKLTALNVDENTALKTLEFHGNSAISSINLSNNKDLEALNCSNTGISSLDISNNAALKTLVCSNNKITVLNISNNPLITDLRCANNNLTSLDLSALNASPSTFICFGNIYNITLTNGTFDLSKLPGDFDVSKASSWSGGTVDGNILTPTEDRVTYTYDCGNRITAEFILKVMPEYTITLIYQDDITDDGSLTTEGGKLTSLPEPTREGYTFKGWFDAATGGNEVTADTVFEADATIYAQWEVVENKAEKAAEDISTALDDLKPTNDTTIDDVKKIVDDNKGDTDAAISAFELTPATEDKEGSLKVVVVVSDGTNTETVEKTYTIDKLPENEAAKAANDIDLALDSLKPTNDTTIDDVKKIVDDNKGDTDAAISAFELTPATEDKEGSLKVVVVVSDGTNTETVEKIYTIDKLPKHEHIFGAWEIVREATATEEGLLRRTCTVDGCTETEEKIIPKLEEITDSSEGGNVVDKTPEDNGFSAELTEIAEVAENIELTPDESAAIADGSTLNIFLKVTETLGEGREDDEAAITDKADSEDLTIGSFLDVTLFKQIDDETPVAVTETKKPIKVSFVVPDDLIAEGRTYFIIRTHGTETTVIECTFDAATKTCTFETDKFSSYAIAYKTTEEGEPDPDQEIIDFVERLYTKLLGRASDPKGKANHIQRLKDGQSASDIVKIFVTSPELRSKKLTNREFVKRMYLTMLDRSPDAKGLNHWATALDNGCSYSYVLQGFSKSAEFTKLCQSYGITRGTYTATENRDKNENLTAYVSRMYTKALNRTYDIKGLNNHTGRYLANTKDAKGIARDFIFSAEFRKRNLTDDEFIDTMYSTLLDRAPDAKGKANWQAKMKNGMTREQVFNGFTSSAEFKKLVDSFGI